MDATHQRRSGCPHCQPALSASYRGAELAACSPKRWACARCGLDWYTGDEWGDAPEGDGPGGAVGPEAQIEMPASLANVAAASLILLPMAFLGLAMPALLGLLAMRMTTFDAALVTVVALPGLLGALVGGTAMVLWWHCVMQLVAPAALAREGDTLCVRVYRDTLWPRRTDARLPLRSLRGARVRGWQRGTRQVWVEHESGAAFCVASSVMPEQAGELLARVRGLVGG